MHRPRLHNDKAAPAGFTLIEVMVAVTVLTIGLMASALLMSTTFQYSVRSRYMAEATQLASEKLEDLNRYPQTDAHVTVMSGDTECGITGENCEGSIAAAYTCASTGNCTTAAAVAPASITVSGTTSTVYYEDSVFIAATNSSGSSGTVANGSLQETYQTAGGTSPQYATLTFSPNGLTPTISTSTTAPTLGETFDRRWEIEQDQPVTGVRRVTVLVTLMDLTVNPAVTFQMSMVRP